MTPRITIVLADDHALLRDVIADRLNEQPDLRVVASCERADDALTTALQLRPNVLLLDIDMPGRSAFEVAQLVREGSPDTRIVFLSAFVSDFFVGQALAAEAAGYLTKGESPAAVIKAIRDVQAGEHYFSPEVRARLVVETSGVRLATATHARTMSLTGREVEILRHMARAMSRKAIAQTMHLSVHTVDRHTTNLMKKLDIHSRAELCRFAIQEGLAKA
jgi:DNA-binding NarL/FixJ family response regulator